MQVDKRAVALSRIINEVDRVIDVGNRLHGPAAIALALSISLGKIREIADKAINEGESDAG